MYIVIRMSEYYIMFLKYYFKESSDIYVTYLDVLSKEIVNLCKKK